MAEHNDFGKAGEDLAVDFLIKNGYTIRDRNWRSGHKELDIVAEIANTLVVVEVKSRKNNIYGRPEEAVNERKIRRIVLAADAYVRFFRIDLPVRFDIIAITESNGKIEHYADAFRSPVWYR